MLFDSLHRFYFCKKCLKRFPESTSMNRVDAFVYQASLMKPSKD
jgi:hypothetical protein